MSDSCRHTIIVSELLARRTQQTAPSASVGQRVSGAHKRIAGAAALVVPAPVVLPHDRAVLVPAPVVGLAG
eukprot:24785-Rhodomonas_salina.2